MSPRSQSRTATCSKEEARIRLDHARKFYEVADLVKDEAGTIEPSASVAASLAVLAGIAAADAACCAALGLRSRGQSHKEAVELVRQVQPGGAEAGRRLDRLLNVKDTANYGITVVSGADLLAALRNAKALVEFASDVLLRT